MRDDFCMPCHAGEYQPFRSNLMLNEQYWASPPTFANATRKPEAAASLSPPIVMAGRNANRPHQPIELLHHPHFSISVSQRFSICLPPVLPTPGSPIREEARVWRQVANLQVLILRRKMRSMGGARRVLTNGRTGSLSCSTRSLSSGQGGGVLADLSGIFQVRLELNRSRLAWEFAQAGQSFN